MLDKEGSRGKRASRIVDPVCVFWNFSLSTGEYVYTCMEQITSYVAM